MFHDDGVEFYKMNKRGNVILQIGKDTSYLHRQIRAYPDFISAILYDEVTSGDVIDLKKKQIITRWYLRKDGVFHYIIFYDKRFTLSNKKPGDKISIQQSDTTYDFVEFCNKDVYGTLYFNYDENEILFYVQKDSIVIDSITHNIICVFNLKEIDSDFKKATIGSIEYILCDF